MIRSKEFKIFSKPDALLKEIYVTLDVAIELCERLKALEQLYWESRPLPRNGRLHSEEMVEQESTYTLDLSVSEYRQNLQITQSKKILTRGPCDSINIPDVGEFRREPTTLWKNCQPIT